MKSAVCSLSTSEAVDKLSNTQVSQSHFLTKWGNLLLPTCYGSHSCSLKRLLSGHFLATQVLGIVFESMFHQGVNLEFEVSKS